MLDNDPDGAASGMLGEFPRVELVRNPTAQRGSGANFEALDIGIRHARHDLLGLLHSDTVFLQEGWDLEWFGRLEREDLAVLSTFEREANPLRPLRKRMGDRWRHWFHQPRPAADVKGKLMLFWLLTRKSVLAELGLSFKRDGHVTPANFARARHGVEVLSRVQISRFMWHTSNITSLLTGQMDDPALRANYEAKRAQFLSDPFIRERLGEVLPVR